MMVYPSWAKLPTFLKALKEKIFFSLSIQTNLHIQLTWPRLPIVIAVDYNRFIVTQGDLVSTDVIHHCARKMYTAILVYVNLTVLLHYRFCCQCCSYSYHYIIVSMSTYIITIYLQCIYNSFLWDRYLKRIKQWNRLTDIDTFGPLAHSYIPAHFCFFPFHFILVSRLFTVGSFSSFYCSVSLFYIQFSRVISLSRPRAIWFPRFVAHINLDLPL